MENRTNERNTLGRRSLIAGLGATGLSALVAPSVSFAAPSSQPTKAADNGHVFLNYTQESLDNAYNQLFYAPDGLTIVNQYTELSKAARTNYNFTTHSYGKAADETLDYFPAKQNGAPIFVFIHGGEWRSGAKEMYSFLAPTFVDAGINFISLDFSVISKVRIPGMAGQLSTAVEWIFHNARKLGGDPNRIFIGGHSSGGHLTAVLAATDWRGHRVPRDVIKGALCISGMYDLYPVLLSFRRDYVALTPKERDDLSPMLHIDSVRCPVVVAHGTEETPEFQRQAVAFAAALRSQTHDFVVSPNSSHFEILLQLADPASELTHSFISTLILTSR